MAANVTAQAPAPAGTCPQTLDGLAPKLLADLPSYSNRVIQRSIVNYQQNPISRSYVIIASQPELDPLPLSQRQYQPAFPDTSEQLFFTLLERQYATKRVTQLQSFYWGFFTLTDQGWRLLRLFSQLASTHKNDPPLPPQEVSNGAIGQAINLWLRDCNAEGIQSSISN
ncbi:MAG: hypothetical protein VKJ02_08295 [Snowella sp.]|nr:hypothetical protein [Snowella sp.]